MESVEFRLLLVFLVIGGPLNVYTILWNYLHHRRRVGTTVVTTTMRQNQVTTVLASELSTIQRHLNLADFFIICLYVPLQLAEMTYNWSTFNNMTCKFATFTNVFFFHASSNIVACIALDRAVNLFCWPKIVTLQRLRISTVLVGGSWLFAYICSLPQLTLWTVHQAQHTVDQPNNEGSESNSTTSIMISMCMSESQFHMLLHTDVSKHENVAFALNLFHLITIFWIPATIMTISYTSIVFFVWNKGHHGGLARRRGAGGTLAKIAGSVCRSSAKFVVLYCICWCPYNVATLLSAVELANSDALSYLHHMIVMNSILNPLVNNFSCDNTGCCWRSKCCSCCGRSIGDVDFRSCERAYIRRGAFKLHSTRSIKATSI